VNLHATSLHVPRKVAFTASIFYIFAVISWFYLYGGFSCPNWVKLLISSIAAAATISFFIALICLLRLILRSLPEWLGRTQAAYLVVVGLLIQSFLVGILALWGAWLYEDLWYLGLIPLLWR
jgi:hypothetical protein